MSSRGRITIWRLVKCGVPVEGRELAYWDDIASVEWHQALAEIAKRPDGTYAASVDSPEIPDGLRPVGNHASKTKKLVVAHGSGGAW